MDWYGKASGRWPHGGGCILSGSEGSSLLLPVALLNFCLIPYSALSSTGDLSSLQISCGFGKMQAIVTKPSKGLPASSQSHGSPICNTSG